MSSCHPHRDEGGWRMRSLATALLILAAAVAPALAPAAETRIVVDGTAPGQPLPHFWERMFGSGRAVLSLRESYRDDLRAVRDISAVGYVRFHGIFLDELGFYG